MKQKIKIAIGCHFEEKNEKMEIKEYIWSLGYRIKDCGSGRNSTDINYIINVSKAVSSGECEKGILISPGLDNGADVIVANKVPEIRAASYRWIGDLQYGRKQLDVNILCLPQVDSEWSQVKPKIREFLGTEFPNKEKDEKVIRKIRELEK